jgi:hypothetical protein
MKAHRLASTVSAAGLALATLATAAGCTSKSEAIDHADDASVCPETRPNEGAACAVPVDTRCTFGDACSGAAFVCGKSATWERGAFTSRCDGG